VHRAAKDHGTKNQQVLTDGGDFPQGPRSAIGDYSSGREIKALRLAESSRR
jgi:hypothetical protein